MADFDDNYEDDYVDSNDTIEESEDIQDASEDYPEDSDPDTEDFPEDVDDDVEEEPEDSEPETEDFPEDVNDDVEEEPEDSEPDTEDFPKDMDGDVEEEPEDSEPDNEDFPEDVDGEVADESEDSNQETYDPTENENDEVEEVSEDKNESDNTTEDIEGETDANDLQSIVEQSEREMHEAWAEAEAWADANGMTEWSDGTPRMNANIDNDIYIDSEESNDVEPKDKTLEYVDNGEPSAIDVCQNENKSEEDYYDDPETALAHIDEQVEAFEKECLTQEVEQNNENLNKDYINLLNKKDAAFSATIDASTPEEARRYADIQYELGEQMEEIKRKIIENNNRLK